MQLQPIGDNIILKIATKEKEEKRSSGLIVVNEGTQQALRTDTGEVVAIGTGRVFNDGRVMPPTVKMGEIVIYNKFAGTEITDGEATFLILKETDILAISR